MRLISLLAVCVVLLVGCTDTGQKISPSHAGSAGAGAQAGVGGAAGHGGAGGAIDTPSGGTGGAIDTQSGGTGGTIEAGGNGGAGGVGATGGIETSLDAGALDGGDAATLEPSERAITADFLAQTLSIVDVDLLAEGASRADALIGTVDLSAYAPGPLSLAITPDGKTALVSISAGFLGAFIEVPPGDGVLLFVDIETRSVVDELEVGDSPMGIAITPDGKTAFVGLYGESYFAVVDLATRTFDTVTTGSGFNEELAIDDSGTVGILTYGPAGNAKTFSIADPAGMNGQTLGLSGDAAGVAFFPGTQIAYLMQAPTVLTGNVGGHDLIDVSDPEQPVVLAGPRTGSHPTTYPVTSIPARGSIAFTSTEDDMVSVVEMALSGDAAMEKSRVVVGAAASLAYGLCATRDGRVLIAVPGEHNVGVVDLASGSAFMVPWELTQSGPTEIKIIP